MIYFLQAIRTRGLCFIPIYFLESIFFDLRYHVDTSFRVSKDKQSSSIQSLDSKNGLLYVASFSSVIHRTFHLSSEFLSCYFPNKNFQFIDLGCGKGKSLLYISKNFYKLYPYCMPLGIEYDTSLVQTALDNLCISPTHIPCKVVHDSAVNFPEYIASDLLIVYLYNSFQGSTLDSVINQLLAYHVVVIYVDPCEDYRFDESSYFTLLHSHKGRYNADTWKIYTNIVYPRS